MFYIECIIKIIKKIVYILNQIEDGAVFLICLISMLLGVYCLYDRYIIYSSATDNSLIQYKPDYDGDIDETKEIQGNMVAWLTINNTSIDYPIMQGDTNIEYLNKNPYGEYSLSGSIFLDFRNKSDFSDAYSLIYGHHMDGNVMFGELDNYLDEIYFNQHKNGTLFVGNKKYEYNIFAVVETEATNDLIFAPTEKNVNETWDFILSHAVYFDENNVNKKQQLLALSTCKYPDTAERTVVIGILNEKEGT